MLEVDGYVVTETNSTDGLVERILADPPDVVLLDFHMPQASGLDILARLSESEGRTVPVIMLTGEANAAEIAIEALKLGALDYLVKPVALDRLHASVRAVLRLVSVERERSRLGQALAAAERLHDAIVTASGAALIVIDARDTVIRVSPTAAARLGGSADGLLGRPIGDVLGLDPERLESARRAPAAAAEAAGDVTFTPWLDAAGDLGLVIVLDSRYQAGVDA